MDVERVSGHAPRAITGGEGAVAAVLVPVLSRRGEPHLLFTRRADHLGEHPGQMSFPGGGREPIDGTLEATAVREAHEEIGLVPREADLVGQLDDIRTVTGYVVSPFVGRIPDRPYHPDEREVAEIAVLPVAALADPTNYEAERREHPYHGETVVPYFHVDGYTVWGATARILVQLLELTTAWRAPEAPDHGR